jgi:hypothetical protein
MRARLDDKWAVTTPAEVDLDGAQLSELDRFLEHWPKRNIHALVVARRGSLSLSAISLGRIGVG